MLWVVDEGSGSEVSKFRQREANFRAGWEIVISVGKIPNQPLLLNWSHEPLEIWLGWLNFQPQVGSAIG